LVQKQEITSTICQFSRYNLGSKPQIKCIAVNHQGLNFRDRNNKRNKEELKIFIEAALRDTNLLYSFSTEVHITTLIKQYYGTV